MFDVTQRDTFAAATVWYDEIRKQSPDVPLVLCGNKVDLRGAGSRPYVFKEEGERLAKIMGCAYVETSALTGQAVDELFRTLAGEIHALSTAKRGGARGTPASSSMKSDHTPVLGRPKRNPLSSTPWWLSRLGRFFLCLPSESEQMDEPYATLEL